MTQAMQHDQSDSESDLPIDIDDLLAGFAHAGDRDKSVSIEVLYHHYKPLAVRYARSTNAVDLEGIVNSALFDTFRALSYMRSTNSHTFRRYLYRAIENYSMKEGRKPAPTPMDLRESDLAPVEGFETELVGTIHLGDLIGELPSDQRAVMTHRIINGLSASETGLILGKKPNAVYQLQHRAVRRLQRMLLAAAVLIIVLGAAVLIARQANRQRVDSSPARPTVDQFLSTTTSNPEIGNQTPSGDETRSEGESQIDAGIIEQPQVLNAESAPRVTEAPTPTAGDTVTTAPLNPSTTITSAEVVSASSTSTSEPGGPSQPVIAVDDVLELTIGQRVDYNVMANDGPRPALGTVSRISGSVEGLTLGSDGRLTGIPSETRTATIIYRLTGTNDTTDTAQVRIVVR